MKEVVDLTRTVLGIPDDYRIAIVPGSDTGEVEMVLRSLLGPRGVDVLAWESFGNEWVADITRQLRLVDARVLQPLMEPCRTCGKSIRRGTWCSHGTARPPVCVFRMVSGFPPTVKA